MGSRAPRGYFGIGVEGISKPMNFGNLMRTAHGFGASFVFTIAPARVICEPKSDTTHARDHMPWYSFPSPGELVLLVFGLLAQAIFFGRWVVQWLASERRGESHMPELFWWLSLLGASMLLVYFILRHEPVGMIGQCVGWTVYARNLHLIHRARRKPA